MKTGIFQRIKEEANFVEQSFELDISVDQEVEQAKKQEKANLKAQKHLLFLEMLEDNIDMTEESKAKMQEKKYQLQENGNGDAKLAQLWEAEELERDELRAKLNLQLSYIANLAEETNTFKENVLKEFQKREAALQNELKKRDQHLIGGQTTCLAIERRLEVAEKMMQFKNMQKREISFEKFE